MLELLRQNFLTILHDLRPFFKITMVPHFMIKPFLIFKFIWMHVCQDSPHSTWPPNPTISRSKDTVLPQSPINKCAPQPLCSPHGGYSNLQSLLLFCDTVPDSTTFKALYVTCFFSFLRISNILQYSLSAFDNTGHLSRGDFIMAGDGAVLLIKWSQTIQDRKSTVTIPLPNLGHSPLCPIAAINHMILTMPASSNDPLFTITRYRMLVPLTDSVARKHLKNASLALNISPSLTIHAFRRAGASWAFSHGVPFEHIMRHGTWKSSVIWTYLSSSPSTSSPVSAAFQTALHN